MPTTSGSLRKFSSSLESQSVGITPVVASVHDHGSRIEVRAKNWPNSLHIPHVWLRDHCRCAQCYDPKTFQCNFDVATMPLNIRPSKIALLQDELHLTWPDGHESRYTLQFLWHHSHGGHTSHARDTRVAWSAKTFPPLHQISVPESTISGPGLRKVFTLLEQYGVALITEVSPDLDSTIAVSNHIGPTLKTFYGDTWVVRANGERADAAYTRVALGAHTDGTYFTQAPRVQVFHMVEAAPEGGETLLVDGLRVAQVMQTKHPDAYDFFSTHAIPGQYIGDGQQQYALLKTFIHHPVTGAFQQFRYNLYDRAPLSTLSVGAVEQYYRHLQTLASVVTDQDAGVWLKLQPGSVLFVDNWRVLHGRAAFSGPRCFLGCYISNDDYISTLRTVMQLNVMK
ncbi:trimethyllysine dioxygenase, mitochondrial isoform X2 [Hyalella azteca]|uniref:Trimethyllysine dioxygenase, mitochondrial n=1 Tax=Hyalella azteca TaxID=294128 RepID=A0A8B7NTM0_HYAAZ|nr:trimethyllysine dioxygenase, mitochondrial isoform X2 [Hyalella azteca]